MRISGFWLRRLRRVFLLVLFLGLTMPTPARAWDLWLITNQHRVLVIRDLDTAPTQVHLFNHTPIAGAYNEALGDFAFAGNGTLYGVSVTLGSPSGLYTIDPTSGAVAHLGDFPFEWGNSLYFDPRSDRGYVGGGLESWSPYQLLYGFYIFTAYDPATTTLWHDMRSDFPSGGYTAGYAHHDGHLFAFWGIGHMYAHTIYLLRITEDGAGNFVSYVNLGDVESRGIPEGAWDIISDGVNLYAVSPQALYRIGDYQGAGPATYTKVLDFALEAGETVNGATAPWADLELSLQALPASSGPVGAFEVVVEVTNRGPHPAERVRVQVPLPADTSLSGQTASQGAYDPATEVWMLGTLAAGATARLTLALLPTSAGPFRLLAWVSHSSALDPDSSPLGDLAVDDWGDGLADDDEAAATYAPEADLALTKTVDPLRAGPGAPVVFTVTVSNAGPSGATGVEVTDQLPSGYAYVSSAPSQGAYDPASGVWTVGDLANGASATLEITATVQARGEYTNAAEVTAVLQVDPDSVPGDGTGDDYAEAAIVYEPEADLSVTKTATPTTAEPGDTVVFTVTVSNAGPNDAAGVEVTERLPAGFTLLRIATSQGRYDARTGVWEVGRLPAGAAATLTLTARAHTSGEHVNVAEVTAADTADPDSTPGDGRGDDYARLTVRVWPPVLPTTGFPPGQVGPLAPRPAGARTLDVRLRIPRLGVDAPVVGVPLTPAGWDVAWLYDQVGWLQGSAFPTWAGNTVLTGHVWNADNTPGLFYGLPRLRYGDLLILEVGAARVTYRVVDAGWVAPQAVDAVFAPASGAMLTLVTCSGYDPTQGQYTARYMLRAVPVPAP